MADEAPEIVLVDPDEVLKLLMAGDRLAHMPPDIWRLVRAGARVDHGAATALTGPRLGPAWFEGAVVPLGDTLLPGVPSQTWVWTREALTDVAH